jgi:hypothetical protein
VVILIGAESLSDGHEVVQAGGGFGPFPGLLQGGKQHGGENGDDRDNDKQFDQCERRRLSFLERVHTYILSVVFNAQNQETENVSKILLKEPIFI